MDHTAIMERLMKFAGILAYPNHSLPCLSFFTYLEYFILCLSKWFLIKSLFQFHFQDKKRIKQKFIKKFFFITLSLKHEKCIYWPLDFHPQNFKTGTLTSTPRLQNDKFVCDIKQRLSTKSNSQELLISRDLFL